jgi:hypothetical protein
MSPLLGNPKGLIAQMQTLPLHLFRHNILSETSMDALFSFYEHITEQLDRDLNLQFFMFKKKPIYCYLHELVEFIRFL